jgi:hypothetical protein
MKKCNLEHKEGYGFIIVDEEGAIIKQVDPGDIKEEIDWELVESQANICGYSLWND